MQESTNLTVLPPATPLAGQHTAAAKFRELKHMIGNTPLLAIRCVFRGKERVVYAKAEHLNMTGSLKDRMAFHILKKAYEENRIEPGYTIAEVTSGNTGIAFASIGRALGNKITIFMPDWMSQERVSLIKSLGAKIVLVCAGDGGFLGSIQKANELAARDPHVFLPSQFSNEANVEAHEKTTGPELWWQLFLNSLEPNAFVAGVGTGGTIMGVGRFLKRQNPSIKLYPLQPAESPTLTTGHKTGHHRIQGISDEFIPPILHLDELDSVISVHDGDAILMAQKLATKLGLAVGISSGANFIGALLAQEKLGADAIVATVFPDDNKKYLSTGLLRDEQPQPDYLAPHVELLGYQAFKRVCSACFEND